MFLYLKGYFVKPRLSLLSSYNLLGLLIKTTTHEMMTLPYVSDLCIFTVYAVKETERARLPRKSQVFNSQIKLFLLFILCPPNNFNGAFFSQTWQKQ